MIATSKEPPPYKDSFLKNAASAFNRRAKAIRYHGSLEFTFDVEDAFEWLTVGYSSHNFPTIIGELVEGGRVNLYIRSNKRKDRGRVLLEMQELRVPDNAVQLVELFEWTIGKTQQGDQDDTQLWTEIETAWKAAAITLLE